MGRNIHLYAAGSNAQGQLGTTNCDDAHTFSPCAFAGSPPGELPPGTESIVHITGGGNHTLALLSRRASPDSPARTELWGCGDGSKDQLGPEYAREAAGARSAVFRRLRLPLAERGLEGYEPARITACWETSFVVLRRAGWDDALLSMGGDDFGDLGVGGAERGQGRGSAQEERAASPVHVVDFATVVGPSNGRVAVVDVAAGPHHVVVCLRVSRDDGLPRELVVGWGTARHGQLGRAVASASGRPVAFVASPRHVQLDGDGGGDGNRGVAAVALGNQHSVFLRGSGRVSGLGSDKKGQVQGLSSFLRARAVGCTWHGTYVLVEEAGRRALMSAGSHAKGQLGRPFAPRGSHSVSSSPAIGPVEFPPSLLRSSLRLRRFACGSEHVLACFSDSDSSELPRETEVWGWGWNEHGNLGLGTLDDVHIPVKVWPPPSLANAGEVVGIWAGCGTSWIAVMT